MIATPLENDLSAFEVLLRPSDSVRVAASSDEVSEGMTAAQAYQLDGLSALPSKNDLRMVLLVGERDRYPVTNPSITAAFADTLRSFGVDVEVITVPDVDHEDVMYVDTAGGQATLQAITDLLALAP